MTPIIAMILTLATLIALLGLTLWQSINGQRHLANFKFDQQRLMEKSLAAILAAPHLNPNPEAQPDNQVILEAWEKAAKRYLKT